MTKEKAFRFSGCSHHGDVTRTGVYFSMSVEKKVLIPCCSYHDDNISGTDILPLREQKNV